MGDTHLTIPYITFLKLDHLLDTFLKIAAYVGIPIRHSKTVALLTCVPIHGITVDYCRHASHQINCFTSGTWLHLFFNKRSAKLRLWQSLLGHLSFTCRVICPGRPF